MATRLIEEQNITVTAQEAESILELWAKRQSENEALRARTTVSDLAEAMAVPPSEVLNMLVEVRGAPVSPPIQPQELSRRKRNLVLMGVAGVAWIALLIFAIGLAYSMGKGRATATELPKPPEEYAKTTGSATGATAPTEATEKFGAGNAVPTAQ